MGTAARIEVAGLSQSYGPTEALKDISFTVPSGQICGYLGPNGAGKSTTIGCISTLVRPTSGRILVDGVDLHRSASRARRSSAGRLIRRTGCNPSRSRGR